MYKFGMSLRQTRTYETHKKYIKNRIHQEEIENRVSRNCRRTRGGGLATLEKEGKPFGKKKKILDI